MMRQKVQALVSLILVLCLAAGVAIAGEATAQGEFGVYEMVVENAQGSPAEIAQAIQESAVEAGWTALATLDAGAPKAPLAPRSWSWPRRTMPIGSWRRIPSPALTPSPTG